MDRYPIFFKLFHVVETSSYKAAVSALGRAVMTLEEGEWWLSGVEMGGVTVCSGSIPTVAQTEFKRAFAEVLSDLGLESSTFDEFRSRATAAFGSINEHTEKEWQEARVELLSRADLPSPLGTMPRTGAADITPRVFVEEKNVSHVMEAFQMVAPDGVINPGGSRRAA